MASGGYYDIDDILAEAEVIPCSFTIDALNLGYLDEGSEESDMKSGSRVELPFWLTRVLATRGMVSLEMPKCFGKKFKKQLLADPRVVDLREECLYFYELGMKLAELARDPEIQDMLQKALSSRYQEIIRRDTGYRSRDFGAFTNLLTNSEQRLFGLKFEGVKNTQVQKLQEAPITTDLRQKKRRKKEP